MFDYVGLHRPKDFVKKIYGIISSKFSGINLKDVKAATKKAFDEYHTFMKKIHLKGMEYLKLSKEKDSNDHISNINKTKINKNLFFIFNPFF